MKDMQEAHDWITEMGPHLGSVDDANVALLSPHLRAYLHETGVIGLMVKHPWVNTTPLIGQVNKMLTAKLGMTREYLGEDPPNWEMYLHVVVERPWRMSTLERMYERGRIDRGKLADLLPGIWTDTELPSTNLDDPAYLWREVDFATDDEEAWEALPETMTVYRGGPEGGISWTLDRERAQWFADRFGVGHPLWTTAVTKAQVFGFLTGRGEQEIILDPDEVEWRKL